MRAASSESPRATLEERTPAGRVLPRALLPPLIMSGIALAGLYAGGFLLFHTLAEIFAILISFTALVVATTSFAFTRNHFVAYIAIATGWSALLDIAHALTYPGMHLLPGIPPDTAIQLWVTARLIHGFALATAPLLLRREMSLKDMHLLFGAATLIGAALIAAGQLPAAFVEGHGLTPFKVGCEYVVIILLAGGAGLLLRLRRHLSANLCGGVLAAILLLIASEYDFTRYATTDGLSNLSGHLLKIFAYWFIYLALVQGTLREPFAMLARAARSYDAVPDPTLIVGADGRIRLANAAAGQLAGVPPEALTGMSRHAIFHQASLPESDCPVCRRVLTDGTGFQVEVWLPDRERTLECSVAPFGLGTAQSARVEVMHDISIRKELQRERESLIHDLAERIKELHGLASISTLSERRDLTLNEYLDGVCRLLPAAFQYDQEARAAILCAWGRFGETPSETSPPFQIEAVIPVDGAPRGALKVWYPSPLAGEFLPEEEALLLQVARTVGETIERLRDADKVKRLSYLYETLSTINRALVYSRNADELMANVLDGLIAGNVFTVMYIAVTDNGRLPLRLTHHHGVPTNLEKELARSLADPHSSFGMAFPAFTSGNVICGPLPPVTGNHDPWLQWLHGQGIREQATVPLLRDGELLAVIGLYASPGPEPFDEEQVRLLNEMAIDIAYGLNTLLLEGRREAAEQLAQQSEHRFRGVFEASPAPMLLIDADNHRLLSMNQAAAAWLGYAIHDIETEALWFQAVFADPSTRESLRQLWRQGIAAAREGRRMESPEMQLRCKDGSERTAQAVMSIVGQDIVVVWNDLTDIRRNEQNLRESERRFRAMIEQTNSGIYVRRDGRYLYANPRYCEITGWPPGQLIGHSVLDFADNRPETLERIRAVWEKVETGGGSVSYTAPMRRHDGAMIELGLNAKLITWDDGLPATIVMAQDITEKKRTEERLAHYVERLESSLKATLQAVSTMVELRDPYTAGHERRVGLIAGDIGRELGWPPERCRMMEMIGLVHDIGKIAVPSEILTKPGRLTPIEMELVKGHAQAGYDILKDVPFDAPVAEAIRQHHERLDGSGYPRGLKDGEILPEARVLAVADVVESMAAHRPYRPALGIEPALAELERGRGVAYDAETVDALVRLVRDKGYRLPQ